MRAPDIGLEARPDARSDRQEAAADAPPPVAVVFTAEDCAGLAASGLDHSSILPLTPTARAALATDAPDASVLDPRRWFTDPRYAEAMRGIRASRDGLDAAMREAGLGAATRWLVVYIHQMVANTAYRIRLTLPEGGPWLVPGPDGFRRHTAREAAEDALYAHIVGNYGLAERWYRYAPPPLAPFYRLCRRIAVRLSRRQGPSWVTQRASHPFGLLDALAGTTPRTQGYHVTRTEAGWREYLRLPREVLRSRRGHAMLQFRAVSTMPSPAAEKVAAAIEGMEDALVRRCMAAGLEEIGRLARLIEGLAGDMADIVRGLRPDVFVAYEIADGFSAALVDACGRSGVRRLISNHNSHAPTLDADAEHAMEHFFTTQYPPELTDEFLMWTPQGRAAAQAYLPPERWPAIRAIRRAPMVASGDRAARQGPRRILHAGNSQRWLTFFPYVFETSDEFMDGLDALVRAVAEVPDSELVVRIKAKPEQRLETVTALLPETPNCIVRTIRDGPFAEDLARADLLACDMSSTITVAIQSRVPVLLWGGTLRYRHLPARTRPPTADDRAAVYTVERAEALVPMIAAILDAHAGRPLTDAEIAPYVWPDTEPDVRQLAQAVAEGDYRRAWSNHGA